MALYRGGGMGAGLMPSVGYGAGVLNMLDGVTEPLGLLGKTRPGT